MKIIILILIVIIGIITIIIYNAYLYRIAFSRLSVRAL